MKISNAWRITLVYVLFGVSWIFLSDWVVNSLFSTDSAVTVQTYKGLLYIAITAALVLWLVWRNDRTLRHSEAHYRTLFECNPDATFVVSTDGRILNANHVAIEQLGYSLEEFRQIDIFDLTPEEDKELVPGKLDRALSTHIRYEGVQLHKDGTHIPVEISTGLVEFEDRDPLILGVTRDLRERKQAEAERERLEQQLRQAQKMEAVGQLAGGVAHDFNNLLQVINGNSELALEDIAAEHPACQSVNEIARAGRRAAALVEQLLAFSRRQVLKLEKLDLNGVVSGILKMIDRVIGEDITIDFVPKYHLAAVSADRGQLEQVLMNLCVNSRDAMPEGGRLVVETDDVELDDDYCASHEWASPGQYVCLIVTDNGVGMDAETRARIWEPFFTTKGSGKGTGLGLAMVYGIVRQHDGMVQVYSEVGKGTVFKVYLRAVEGMSARPERTSEELPRGGSETVLLVEDDDDVRSLCLRILEKAGYNVITATDGEDAIRVMKDRGDEIQLSLLDVVMPRMGGRAVYEQVKDLYPHMRFLFSSGYSVNAVHTGFVLDEGIELIQKPFAPADLLRRIRRVLDS